jgi:hypothetical protein
MKKSRRLKRGTKTKLWIATLSIVPKMKLIALRDFRDHIQAYRGKQ